MPLLQPSADWAYADTFPFDENGRFQVPTFAENLMWWKHCTGARVQFCPSDPAESEGDSAYMEVGYERFGVPATKYSSRVSSNSDWVQLNSREAVENFRAFQYKGLPGYVRIEFLSRYF